ncbi:aldo/keto reductase [Streptomyces sp. SID13031]|uniref:aldo/keto reductase n=1 Tax=Streptomyces sp. SID13031 TaxID=2706046 RepID=UPI0013C5B76B|nr:aldo/keto reductase [Streptomyces sp. SID13031]NEA36552.1 aldo/keto reductase [Streptomyces sp. SID13031]
MSTLRKLQLGTDGPVVSAQGFGAMGISVAYGDTDLTEARATLEHAFELGVTLFDTADAYGFGDNERFLAPFFAAHRDELVIATKFGLRRLEDGTLDIRNDPDYVRTSADASLQRLGVDEIDLYYMHRRDPEVPLEDMVGAMAELVAAGKVKHLGLSEVTGDELAAAHAIHPIAAVQSEWSLFSRDIENQVVPTAARLGIAMVPYSPLGRGLLTGVNQVDPNAANDVRNTMARFQGANGEANQALLEPLRKIAAVRNTTVAQVALAWVHQRTAVWQTSVVPIPGTRSRTRVEENLKALDLTLDDSELAVLEPIAAEVTGARWHDPSFISSGRE